MRGFVLLFTQARKGTLMKKKTISKEEIKEYVLDFRFWYCIQVTEISISDFSKLNNYEDFKFTDKQLKKLYKDFNKNNGDKNSLIYKLNRTEIFEWAKNN